MDLGGAGDAQGGRFDGDGVRAGPGPGGVDAAVEGAQSVLRGKDRVGHPAGDRGGASVQGGHVAQGDGGAGQHHQTVLLQGQPLRLAVGGIRVGDQQNEGGAGAQAPLRGGIDHSEAAGAGDAEGKGGGAASVQVDRPDTALALELLGQVHLGQAAGVAGLPAVGGVEDHGAVLLNAHCGAGSPAGGVVPGGAVGDGAIGENDIAAAAGPLGLRQVGV